ncbi:MAG: chromosome partitioning protein [Gammaproteobacteria bacterium TMED119]|jgi:ATP-binding protein involved in chromosome partitioning|nr:MAG: chromosome partitioning protein [Gammaproteobacteria bacterium TMED119]PDH45929.1 MAG: chromosome partitioning protein [Flavobacteriales bacterium MED-G15]|tara:strand:- start:1291 stop:2421 length:1131 start_codon:yes stop_codon:yes gene_type:complete
MKFNKNEVVQALKTITAPGEGENLIDSGAVTNLMIFGDEVDLDILLKNPSLQARKKLEVTIMQVIHEKVYAKAKIKINTKIEAPVKKETITKGQPIPGIDSIIAISSGKGGVGKSTVTANIAVTLAQMGCKVGILDADIYGPSIPTMFDIEGARPLSVKKEGKSKMAPIVSYGVKILSIGFFTKPDQAVIWRGPMAAKALNQLIFDADWGELDFLLIDLPPGTGDIHLSIVQSLPLNGSVVVSTPQNIALADARKGIAMFNQENIQVPVLGIIENMAYFTPDELPDNKYYIFGKNGAENLAIDKGVPFLGALPLVQTVREASDVGRPSALQEGTSIQKSLVEVTQNMVTQLLKRNNNLPPTKAVEITNMVGCSAIK